MLYTREMADVRPEEQNLRFLASCHNVLGGLAGVFSFAPLILAVGALMDSHGSDKFSLAGGILLLVAFSCLGFGLSAVMILMGRALRRVQDYSSIRTIALLECVLIPFGTVLGIITIDVLSREAVKKLFAARATEPPPLPGTEPEEWNY